MHLFESIKSHFRAYKAFPVFPALTPLSVMIHDPFPFMGEEEDGARAVADFLPVYKTEELNTATITESLLIARSLGWSVKNIYPTGEDKFDGIWYQTFDVIYRTNP